MIIIEIQGGLGNQMFQYAFGESLRYHGYNKEILYDITQYNFRNSHSGYSLKRYFNINLPLASNKQIQRIKSIPPFPENFNNYSNIPKRLFRFYRRLLRRTFLFFGIKGDSLATDHGAFLFNNELFNLSEEKDIYVSGYFQTVEYYEDVLPYMRNVFRFNGSLSEGDSILIDLMHKTNSVSIHVRCGDYINNGTHDLCGIDYYCNAVQLIEKSGPAEFFVFSDDPDYVKENFTFLADNYHLCEHAVEDCNIDLFMMSQCKHHIIPNSTFSLWGALLDDDPGIIIAPKYWLRSSVGFIENRLPSGWVIINNKPQG